MRDIVLDTRVSLAALFLVCAGSACGPAPPPPVSAPRPNAGTATPAITTRALVPPSISAVTKLVVGARHTCALHEDGTLSCWGVTRDHDASTPLRQLGDDTLMSRPTPRAVTGLAGVTQIAAGTRFACALLNDQTVRCWGDTVSGAVGTYVMEDVREPVPVAW